MNVLELVLFSYYLITEVKIEVRIEMKQHSCSSNNGIMDAHVAHLEVFDVVHDDFEPFVLQIKNAKTDDDDTVEDTVKLPNSSQVRIQHVQQSFFMLFFTFLMDISFS